MWQRRRRDTDRPIRARLGLLGIEVDEGGGGRVGSDIPRHHPIDCRCLHTVGTEAQGDIGDQPTIGRGLGDHFAVDGADIRLVRMSGEQHPHRGIDTGCQCGDLGGDIRAAVVVDRRVPVRFLRATIVQQCHDRLRTGRFHLGDIVIDRRDLVAEGVAPNALRENDTRGLGRHRADDTDLVATDLQHRPRPQCGRQLTVGIGDIGGQKRELRSGERRAGRASGERAPALLPSCQFDNAVIEFMIAHRGGGQADGIQESDGRLVVEESGDKRARADIVAGRHHRTGRICLLQPSQVGGEVGGTARVVSGDLAGRTPGWLQIAVEIVEAEQMYLVRPRATQIVGRDEWDHPRCGRGGVTALRCGTAPRHQGDAHKSRDNHAAAAVRSHIPTLSCPSAIGMNLTRTHRRRGRCSTPPRGFPGYTRPAAKSAAGQNAQP